MSHPTSGSLRPGIAAAYALLVAGFVASVAAGEGPRSRAWLLPVAGGLAAVTVLTASHRNRGHCSAAWSLLGLSLLLITGGLVAGAAAGGIVWYVAMFFVLAYLPGLKALLILAKTGRPQRAYGRLDTAIMLVAVTALNWRFLVRPAFESHIDLSSKIGAGALPTVDLVLVALLLRLLGSRNRRVPAFWLILGAGVATLATDAAISAVSLSGTYQPGTWPDAISLLSYALLSLAATHPSMREVGKIGPEPRRTPVRGLLMLLPAGAVVPAFMLAQAAGMTPVEPVAGALVSLTLFLLAMARAILAVADSERFAAVDQLTGLPNRRAFSTTLNALVERPEAATAAVGFLDLDDFKAVNDTHGHAVGDLLIRAVAQRLRCLVDAGDVVARFGGDELGLLLRAPSSTADPRGLAMRIAASLAEPFEIDGIPLRIGASVGLVIGLAGCEPERLMSDADIAMYTAKRAGSGGVAVYTPTMREELLGGKHLMADLAAALRSPDGGGLWVAFQPIVHLSGRAMTGCEALVRWEHPQRGALMPDDFVPLAETAGLAAELDEFVLRSAIATYADWVRADSRLLTTRIGVNMSAATACRPDLRALVIDLLRRHSVPADRLILEITEHQGLPESDQVASTLCALAADGVAVALDDFGTGYNSMLYFERFPVQTVKLDRSIIATVVDGRASAVVVGLAAMASALDLVVLAEGVETADQVGPLQELGFRLAQGWLYAKAGPASGILDYAARHGVVEAGPAPSALRRTRAA